MGSIEGNDRNHSKQTIISLGYIEIGLQIALGLHGRGEPDDGVSASSLPAVRRASRHALSLPQTIRPFLSLLHSQGLLSSAVAPLRKPVTSHAQTVSVVRTARESRTEAAAHSYQWAPNFLEQRKSTLQPISGFSAAPHQCVGLAPCCALSGGVTRHAPLRVNEPTCGKIISLLSRFPHAPLASGVPNKGRRSDTFGMMRRAVRALTSHGGMAKVCFQSGLNTVCSSIVPLPRLAPPLDPPCAPRDLPWIGRLIRD